MGTAPGRDGLAGRVWTKRSSGRGAGDFLPPPGVLTYTAHTFADQLGANWAAYLSPFHYYIGGEPLKHGFQWADAGILAAAAAVLVAAGTYRFNHRDING